MKLLKSVKSRSRSSGKKHENFAGSQEVSVQHSKSVDSLAGNKPEPLAASQSSPSPSPTSQQRVPQHQETRQESSEKLPKQALPPLRLGSFDFESGDDYSYPSLFDEADDMLKLSNLIYTLAEVRELARNGVLADPTKSLRVLQLPLPMDTALSIIIAEADILKEVLNDGKHEAALSALQSLLERQNASKKGNTPTQKNEEEPSPSFGGWLDSWNGCLAGGFSFDELFCGGDLGLVDNGNNSSQMQKEDVDSSMIVHVGDLKSNSELVYAVGINPNQERITVAFRGSVTKTDFVTDAKISMVQSPTPQNLAKQATITEANPDNSIGIHQGFYEYLFGKGNIQKSKYLEIIAHVTKILNEKPNRRREYKLYVTGHSLGGALATLFGFYASASGLPLPVTVISVASPRVGNLAFARHFTELESQGKIRHLRIANHRDPVTLGPTVSSKRALALATKNVSPLGYLALKATGNEAGDEKYYHTGIKMKLRKEDKDDAPGVELSYSCSPLLSGSSEPEVGDIEDDDVGSLSPGRKKSFRRNSGSLPSVQDLPLVSYHYGKAYTERMALCQPYLNGLKLNAVYQENVTCK